jgi:tRNA A37 threonylcarbamoyladenosine modification protein TsaB
VERGREEREKYMMDLFICAQDIQCITFGLVKDQTLFCEKTFDVPPENYLASLHAFLSEQSVSLSDVKRLFVVSGPGSFTASRVSVVMATAIVFARNIPIIPIENPDRHSLAELVKNALLSPEHLFVVPTYDRPPNIT